MRKHLNNIPYLLGFVLLLLLCGVEIGPVFRHLAEENYFCTDAVVMQQIINQPFGYVYWVGRFFLMGFQWQWIGAFSLVLMLTFCAWCVDSLLPVKWKGAGFVVPVSVLGWTIYRGYNLYMLCDPSQWLVIAISITIICALIALVAKFVRGKKEVAQHIPLRKQYGSVVLILSVILVASYAWIFRQNVILSCDMQNKMLDEDWQGMADDGLMARHPDRSVAAFYTIALNQQDILLENLFLIDMNYDDPHLDDRKGMQEGDNYLADIDFHAGMILSTYRMAQTHLILLGPRLRYLKMMAVSAIIQGDQALAYRFLNLIKKMPRQNKFVEKYTYLLQNTDCVDQYPEIVKLLEIAPRMTDEMTAKGVLEQDYSKPLFLGYNLATTIATQESLITSMAATLYMKNLNLIVSRAKTMQENGMQLPICVQQAIVIASLTNNSVLKSFNIDNSVIHKVHEFANDSSPYAKKEDREKAASALKDKWKGTYLYYYFCGNLNSYKEKDGDGGVN